MKIKRFFVIALIILTVLISASSQRKEIDPTDIFYTLKLEMKYVKSYYKNKTKESDKIEIENTYLFFSHEGIYLADEGGLLIYEFKDSVLLEQKFDASNNMVLQRFTVLALDKGLNKLCQIVVHRDVETNKCDVFVNYDTFLNIFYCEEFK
jgi:hypothetical protein